MSKIGEQGKVPPPPLDEDGNPIVGEDGANTETSTALTFEELMRRLEELTAENKKLRAKAKNKKTNENSSSSEEVDSHLKRMSPKRKRKEEEIVIRLLTTQYLLITIICLALSFILPYSLAKLPILIKVVITNESIA
jgi:hypothetical protein